LLCVLQPPIPLIDGESEAELSVIEDELRSCVRPNGPIEEIWFRDAINGIWEMFRHERMKKALIQSGRRKAVEELLLEYLELNQRHTDRIDKCKFLSLEWSAGDNDFVPLVAQELAKHGIDTDAIMARSISQNLDEIQALGRLMSAAEIRREKALKNIDGRREQLKTLRNEITDAEFEELDAAE
jgi:hypothetical protein